MFSRWRKTAIAVSCGVLVLAGCSGRQVEQAVPLGESTSAPSTTTQPEAAFAGLTACELLDELVAGQGFNPGDNISRRNECSAKKLKFGSLAVALDPVQGLTEFRADEPDAVDLQINGRSTLQAVTDLRSCMFALEVSPQARALASANIIEGYGLDACAEAKKLAEALEPRLPNPPG